MNNESMEMKLDELLVNSGSAFYISSKAEQTDCLFYIQHGDGEEVELYAATSRFSLNGPMHYDSTVSFVSGDCMPDKAVEYILSQKPEGSDWKEGKLGE